MTGYAVVLTWVPFLVLHFLVPAYAQELRGIPVSSIGVAHDFSSPQAVFKRYRDAGVNSDYRQCFDCLTPENQRRLVSGMFFQCCESGSAEARRIMAAHIGDIEKVNEEYRKEYKAKRGIEGEPRDAKPEDMEIFTDALFTCMKDKAGCYAEISSLFAKNDSPRFLGELEQVVLDDDKATGSAKIWARRTTFQNGSLIEDKYDSADARFVFRKIDGKWLIDRP